MKRIITKFIIIFTIIVCTLNAITLTTFANIDKKIYILKEIVVDY